jgi:hypothetical protein
MHMGVSAVVEERLVSWLLLTFCFRLRSALPLLEMSVSLLIIRWGKVCFITNLDLDMCSMNAFLLITQESIQNKVLVTEFHYTGKSTSLP